MCFVTKVMHAYQTKKLQSLHAYQLLCIHFMGIVINILGADTHHRQRQSLETRHTPGLKIKLRIKCDK